MLHQLSNPAPQLSKLYHTICFLISLNILSPYPKACQNLLKCLPLHMVSKFELMDGIRLLNLQAPRSLRRWPFQVEFLYFQYFYHNLNFFGLKTDISLPATINNRLSKISQVSSQLDCQGFKLRIHSYCILQVDY